MSNRKRAADKGFGSIGLLGKKPTGFVARCQCGVITGAADAGRTDRKDLGKILGEWLMSGRTVEPRFGGSWSEQVGGCKCEPPNLD